MKAVLIFTQVIAWMASGALLMLFYLDSKIGSAELKDVEAVVVVLLAGSLAGHWFVKHNFEVSAHG